MAVGRGGEEYVRKQSMAALTVMQVQTTMIIWMVMTIPEAENNETK